MCKHIWTHTIILKVPYCCWICHAPNILVFEPSIPALTLKLINWRSPSWGPGGWDWASHHQHGWDLDCCLLAAPPLWQKAEGFLWSFVSMSVPSIEASTSCSKVLPNTHLQILSLCRLGCRDTHLLQLFSLHTKVCQETNVPFTDSWFSTLWILHADSVLSMIGSPLDLREHRSFAQRNCLWVMGRLQPPVSAGLSLSFFLLSLLFYFSALMTQATNSQFFISVFSRISRFIGTGNWREKAVPDASGWGM